MNGQDIIALQASRIKQWKKGGVTACTDHSITALIEQNHRFNYQLWHAEDRARREDKGFEYVYHAKREIDHCNQQRNNRMEAIDQLLWETYKPSTHKKARLHSETPGMMIDRLSIMALKSYHMQLQTVRLETSLDHQRQCQQKLNVILAQQSQLAACYDQFTQEVKEGTATFRVYHQFKMYNDPTLNPELYNASTNQGN